MTLNLFFILDDDEDFNIKYLIERNLQVVTCFKYISSNNSLNTHCLNDFKYKFVKIIAEIGVILDCG